MLREAKVMGEGWGTAIKGHVLYAQCLYSACNGKAPSVLLGAQPSLSLHERLMGGVWDPQTPQLPCHWGRALLRLASQVSDEMVPPCRSFVGHSLEKLCVFLQACGQVSHDRAPCLGDRLPRGSNVTHAAGRFILLWGGAWCNTIAKCVVGPELRGCDSAGWASTQQVL